VNGPASITHPAAGVTDAHWLNLSSDTRFSSRAGAGAVGLLLPSGRCHMPGPGVSATTGAGSTGDLQGEARDEEAAVSDVVFYVTAHTDDALLFRGEGLFTDLHTPDVTTVQIVVTADDAGREDGWWEAHEAACIESLAGTLTPGTPTSDRVPVNGHLIQRFTGPTWALYALRLPDGNVDGDGFPSTHHRTLGKLQGRKINSLPAIDGSTAYDSWHDLVTTVRAIIASERGSMRPWVNTADHDRALNPDDHPDHYAVADAVRQFADDLDRLWWVSYDVRDRPANLAGYPHDIKWFLFRLYGWKTDELINTPPNEEEWTWWGARSYSRTEEAG
jgi:hypothetical protein